MEGVCTYFVANFQVAQNPLKLGMPTLFVLNNISGLCIFEQAENMDKIVWKSTPLSLPVHL